MDFNFYDRYKDYTPAQLLHMLKNPQDYQPAALEAANRIIVERGITEESVEQVDVLEEDVVVADGKQDLLPTHWEETKPPAWVTVVLVVVALQFAWSFFTSFYWFYKMLSGGFFSFRHLPYFISLAYIPIIAYLLLKRKPWGWILLFSVGIFSLITYVCALLSMTWYSNFYIERLYVPLGWIIFNGGLLFCLWKPAMHFYFGVSAPVKRRTLLLSFGITLLCMLIIFIITF